MLATPHYTLPEIAAVCASLTAIAIFLNRLYTKLWKPGRDLVRLVKRKVELLDEVALTLKPNGGSSIRDVLDRLDSRTRLLEERQRAGMDLNPSPFFEADSEGHCVFVNRAWSELTGIRLDEALGSGWLNSVHRDDRERVLVEWEAATKEGRTFRLQYLVQNVRTAKVTPVLAESRPVICNNKAVGHYLLLQPQSVLAAPR